MESHNLSFYFFINGTWWDGNWGFNTVQRLFFPSILLLSANTHCSWMLYSISSIVSPPSEESAVHFSSLSLSQLTYSLAFVRLCVLSLFYGAKVESFFIHLKALWFLSILQHPQKNNKSVCQHHVTLHTRSGSFCYLRQEIISLYIWCWYILKEKASVITWYKLQSDWLRMDRSQWAVTSN